MYLYTGNADQAVVQYKKAIASKPGFFQAYYNMGIALAQMNKPDDAAATLKQAIALAPDDTARDQVKALLAKLSGAPAASASMQAASAATLAAAKISATPAAAVAAKSPAAVSSPGASPAIAAKSSASPAAGPTSGEDGFHDAVETMVRGLPIAGPKVTSVEWPDKLKAKVFMDSFPMDQMPPFAKAKFLTDLKAGIDSAKKDNNISSPVEINIVDGASGSVMETVTE
jgi:tetratricopeptide (TPR) repeat protein